jgi:succinyldiaminopimelate transaminase
VTVPRSPGLRAVDPYPFEELDRRVAEARAAGRRPIDLGVGDPRGETPRIVRDALVAAVGAVSSYPRAAGIPELREAIAGWVRRRFGASLDPDLHVLPTLGAKEIVFSLPQAVVDPGAGKDVVITTTPGYPIPERGARYAGAEVVRLTLRPPGFVPDLDELPEDTWRRAAICWINFPNNPTSAVAPLAFLEAAAERCRAYDVLLASDEAYVELTAGPDPAPGVLQLHDLSNVLAVHTLSKRSSMTGYRSGFVAGDPDLVGALRALRPSVGVTPQEFVQRASAVAWSDDAHVEANRAAYAAKRARFLEVFDRAGVRVAGTEGAFYLWVEVPAGRTSLAWAIDLLERADVVVAPGSFFGPQGEGYVRVAMVPSPEECERAALSIERSLAEVSA